MTVLTGGPPIAPEEFPEHRAIGYVAGRAGLPCEVPTDKDGWALYEAPSPQYAAWCRGHVRGRLEWLRVEKLKRLNEESAA